MPSAIVPETNNILINPEHRDARRVKPASATHYPLDFDGGDVLPGLTYECLGEDRGMLRVLDKSAEDYLYPVTSFYWTAGCAMIQRLSMV